MSISPSGPRFSSDNDVYTVLIMVAFLFVLVATVYLGFKAQQLFGTVFPPGGS